MATRQINRLAQEMDRWFNSEVDRWFKNFRPEAGEQSGPAVNVWVKDDAYFVEVELPGVTQESLDVAVVGRELTIKAQRGESQGEGVKYLQRERGTQTLERKLTMPEDVDADRVEATLRDGVLTVKLPFAAAAQRKTVQVKTD